MKISPRCKELSKQKKNEKKGDSDILITHYMCML